MIILAFAILGALVGGFTARSRGGKGLDIAQYAAGYAMAFAVIGLFLTVFLSRG
ncbi:hypothetical protein [Sinisalibacter aestuarii]|uniref:Apolipoprotein acyltransferase n=1 Tax=Sinisalibacter aestuarii TaxID=2949426 RepID=A0ABQ5LSL0_9RHOB|nr:hypothetical protein [Sinisalibacter aestuarii]GKY87603.1 hypothetical protein STA1M1_14720 [Sinisalibacter aestuarii]